MADYKTWNVWEKDWSKSHEINLADVIGLKWETLEKPWVDDTGYEFPYTILVFMRDGSSYYLSHYCDPSPEGADFSDLLIYMTQLYIM